MGELFRSFWACPALLLVSAAFLTGVVEMEASAPPPAALPVLLMNHAIPQGSSAKLPASASSSPTGRMGDHYLMLVNTAIASQMDAVKMAQFDRSPYDGLAVSFGGRL